MTTPAEPVQAVLDATPPRLLPGAQAFVDRVVEAVERATVPGALFGA